MSEATKCDGCGKVADLNSDDITNFIHVVQPGDEAMDFCDPDCAYHFFEGVHALCECRHSVEAQNMEQEPPGRVSSLEEYRHHHRGHEQGEA